MCGWGFGLVEIKITIIIPLPGQVVRRTTTRGRTRCMCRARALRTFRVGRSISMGIRRGVGRALRLFRKSSFKLHHPVSRISRLSTYKHYRGNSTTADTLNRPPPKTVAQRWAGLSTGAKIAIYVSISAVVLAVIGVSAICCISQRRAGRQERALADANWEKDHAEAMAYRARYRGQCSEI